MYNLDLLLFLKYEKIWGHQPTFSRGIHRQELRTCCPVSRPRALLLAIASTQSTPSPVLLIRPPGMQAFLTPIDSPVSWKLKISYRQVQELCARLVHSHRLLQKREKKAFTKLEFNVMPSASIESWNKNCLFKKDFSVFYGAVTEDTVHWVTQSSLNKFSFHKCLLRFDSRIIKRSLWVNASTFSCQKMKME